MNDKFKAIKFPKIVHFGEFPLTDLKIGIEEKIDGSQMRIALWKEHINFGSKAIDYTEDVLPDNMFNIGIESAKEVFKDYRPEKYTVVFAEYLRKPKHNTLMYERVPKFNLVLFDVFQDGKFLNQWEKREFAAQFGLETAPLLWEGNGSMLDMELITKLLKTPSFLGRETIEGVVLKCYDKLWIPPHHTHDVPMMCKYVREEFKERNKVEWKANSKNGLVETIIEEYRTEARWKKAVSHARDNGLLTNTPKDIGLLLGEVCKDLFEEEGEKIAERVMKLMRKEIGRGVIRGFPEWYKAYLLKEALEKGVPSSAGQGVSGHGSTTDTGCLPAEPSCSPPSKSE